MAYYRYKRGACYIGEETAWGAGSSGLKYLRAKEVTIPPGEDYVEGEDIIIKDAEDVGHVILAPGDVTIKSSLKAAVAEWPGQAPSDNQANLNPLGHLLESGLGGWVAGGYGVTSSSNTTTILRFDPYGDTPTTMGFTVGQLVAVRNAAAENVVGVGRISALDDVAYTVTLGCPLPAAPGNAAIVYGFQNFFTTYPASPKSYEVKFLGEAEDDVRQAKGCVVSSIQIDAPLRGTAEITAVLRSALPTPMDPDTTGGAPDETSQELIYGDTQVISGGLYAYNPSIGLTKLTGSVKIDAGIELLEVAGINGVDPNGVAAYRQGLRKTRVTVTPAYVTAGMWEVFRDPPAAGTMLIGWWGRGCRVFGFCIPCGHLVQVPSLNDQGGVLSTELVFGAMNHADTGDFAADECGDKPFVMGWLAGAIA